MSEADTLPEAFPASPSPPRRRGWAARIARGLLWTLLGIVALIGAALLAIDTDPGHRFIANQIAALKPGSGLRIRIGRIDGSIWGHTRLRDLRLYDASGLFLEVPELDLDWHPTRWIANRLDIDRLETDLAILHRVPKLTPSGKKGPILPGFDIRIGKLAIHAMRIEPAVSGTRRIARIEGRADIRGGRAVIHLAAASNAGDRLAIRLDAQPDRDGFDLETRVIAPAKGVIGGIAGTDRPISLTITGDGRWATWNGVMRMDVSGGRVVDLALGVRSGRYTLSGMLAPSPLLQGKLQRLTAPHIAVKGVATLANRRLDGSLSLRAPALALNFAGGLDLARSMFDDFKVDADLIRPPAMFPNMSGRDVRLHAVLNGEFATARFDYRVSARHLAFDQTGFDDVLGTGQGNLSKAPVTVPIRLIARRVTGVGDVAGGILANLRVEGVLRVSGKDVRGDDLAISSDKLKGKLTLFLDFVTGHYDVAVTGGLTRYFIPGIGIVDVETRLSIVPGARGIGTIVQGRGKAIVRRFDNAFLRSLAGGLPVIETNLIRGPDGVLLFRNLVLTGPAIRITGSGMRRRDGTFQFEGSGTQRQYGPLKLVLDGNISRPKVNLILARPMDSLGLSDVHLDLDPNPTGFAYRANGGSTLGPFTSSGQILLPAGSDATIGIAALDVAGTHGSGAIQSRTGGFLGRLGIAGGGLDGELVFSPVLGVQEIRIALSARDTRFPGPPEIAVRRGRIDGTIRLDPAGIGFRGSVRAAGLRRGGFSIARLAGTADLAGGSGTVRVSIAGSRGRAFTLTTEARISPDRIELAGDGTLDRRPIRLTTPAVLTRDDDGWRLARTDLEFSGGKANLAGHFGGEAIEIEAGLDRMPLGVLDMALPDLGLGGSASGTLSYRWPKGGAVPTGRADLRIRGLTRSGLVLSSQPIDVAIAAALTGDRAALRAVMGSGGRVIGRAQARIAPLTGAGDLMTRLQQAPLFAQLRYIGPADTLWRLTGIETIDLSGPVQIGTDISGTLADPRIRGTVRTSGARMESAVTGTIITGLQAQGTFDGSRLIIPAFQGATPGGGSLTGKAAFDLAAVNGFGMDIAIQASEAKLLARDDIGATVTGPLTIRSDGSGGTIAGDVSVIQGNFRLGSAAAAAIPQLNVVEINRPPDESEDHAPARPWQLDVHARARNRLAVTGLGLDSEWRADLNIKGTVDNPAISGRADLVRGGYEFAGRRFDLDRGTIRFLGEAPPDPVLDIVARASIQGLNATITVSGTGQRPEIHFASVPALPEDELLSRLLFGTSITNLSAPEALQLAAAVASLQGGGGGGLNPINVVRRAAGLDRLRILPADVTTGQRTSVAAGKYIGRRVYVEVITDGQGYSATSVEFQITRWLSLLSSISTLGRSSANVRVSKDY